MVLDKEVGILGGVTIAELDQESPDEKTEIRTNKQTRTGESCNEEDMRTKRADELEH